MVRRRIFTHALRNDLTLNLGVHESLSSRYPTTRKGELHTLFCRPCLVIRGDRFAALSPAPCCWHRWPLYMHVHHSILHRLTSTAYGKLIILWSLKTLGEEEQWKMHHYKMWLFLTEPTTCLKTKWTWCVQEASRYEIHATNGWAHCELSWALVV